MITGIDLVVDKLAPYGVKKSGASWVARCPAHEDSNPSLSVSVGRDQPVVFRCHAGCDAESILAALNLTWADVSADLPERDERPQISATYDYVNEAGDLLYQVVRMTPKSFRQRRPDGKGGWIWRLDDVRRPVFHLPEVRNAIANGDPIFVCEGEKDVEAIRRAGFVATCNSGGAGKWLSEHTQALVGASVLVVADRDTPGRKHARAVAAALDTVAADVRCVEPAEGKDVADHLAAGRTLDELLVVDDRWESDLAEPTNDGDPGPDETPHPADEQGAQQERTSAVDRMRGLLLDGITVKQIPSRRSLVKGWLDLNSLAVLFGPSGAGKSFVAIDMALHVAIGQWWQGHKTRKGTALYVVAEGATGIADRQTAWEKHNRHHAAIDGIHWLPRPVNLLDVVDSSALTTVAAELEPSLVVIDTLARSMSGGDENAGKDMSRVIEAADHIKTRTGACVLVVHHTGKDQAQGARGWSGLKGALDTELELKSADNILTLTTSKQKDNAEQQPLRLTLVPHTWACPTCDGKSFMPDGDECDRCDGDGEVGSVAIASYTGRDHITADLREKAQTTFDALLSIDTGSGVPGTTWRDVAHDAGVTNRSSFYRYVKSLVDAGLVHQGGTDARPIYYVQRPGAA